MKLFFELNDAATRLENAAQHSDEKALRATTAKVAEDMRELMSNLAPTWGALQHVVKALEKGEKVEL